MEEKKYLYQLEFSVRDYECDLQGIVNNANYQHFLEHARHEYLVSKGVLFSDLHDEGIDLIVTNVTINYKFPLKSRDRFIVCLNLVKKGHVRMVFEQDIYRLPDMKHIVNAEVTGAATKSGRPVNPDTVFRKLGL